MEEKKIIRAADYLPETRADSSDGQDFALPVSEQILYGLFGASPDYDDQKFEDLWQEVLNAEDEDTIAYCLENGVDVMGDDGEAVPGWRDIAVMLKAIERGFITIEGSEDHPMETIDDILDYLVEEEAGDPMIVEPATEEDLKLCQEDMAEMEFPPIPQGYADFLRKLNGFAWNGVEFFSADQVVDNETGFMLIDIVTANEDFEVEQEDYELEHCVYLGRSDDDLYVYNTKNEKYEVLDFTGRDVMEEHDTFESLFVSVVAPRL